MGAAVGVILAAGGWFLAYWYRTVVALPLRRQPSFARRAWFKWGLPLLCLSVFLTGLCSVALRSRAAAVVVITVAVALGWLAGRHDRYSVEMETIYDQFRRIRCTNPSMEEFEVLYHTAQWRYPKWGQDRLVELIAGKDVENLILLMVIRENEINPISDWGLYRKLKRRASAIVALGTRTPC